MNTVHEQSPDIAQGVDGSLKAEGTARYDLIGAGDQGMVFGYACTDTPVLMPLPIFLAHRLCERLTEVRKNGSLAYLRPDGKVQVSIQYEDDIPQSVCTILISTQHADGIDIDTTMRRDLIQHVIQPVMDTWQVAWSDAEILINPTGRFVVGGPAGDTGLTGRKIIVDTNGGMARHGGGAFSGKDSTKVDRSASYAARWIAKNVVAAGFARRCEVQIAYAIGVAKPLSLMIETFGTNTLELEKIEAAVRKVFDLRPAALVDSLQLQRPLFRLSANYGHFGRELEEFTWEKTNKVQELQEALLDT
jgi:S-adenosylmethionine synthetase